MSNSKTVDLGSFLHLQTAKEDVEQEIQEAIKPFADKQAEIRAELDALATDIGKVHGAGTYKMPDGQKWKVRSYRKDDSQGRVGFYFLPYEAKDKGVKDLSATGE